MQNERFDQPAENDQRLRVSATAHVSFQTLILDLETIKVTNFYKVSPFPNYKINDNKTTILKKGKKNFLTSRFKDFIGYQKNVLEVGCGTGQL